MKKKIYIGSQVHNRLTQARHKQKKHLIPRNDMKEDDIK